MSNMTKQEWTELRADLLDSVGALERDIAHEERQSVSHNQRKVLENVRRRVADVRTAIEDDM